MLRTAKQLGRVVIITNAEQDWVKESAAKHLPEVARELDGLPIVSARDIFEPMGHDDPQVWKTFCFKRVARCLQVYDRSQHTATIKKIPLVSIGDSQYERVAAQLVAHKNPFWNVATVKLRETPTIDELTLELNLCSDSLAQMLPQGELLDFQINDACQLELVPVT